MDEQLLKSITQVMDERPLNLESNCSFVNDKEKDALLKNNNDIAYISGHLQNPLKVVLMGEVKAGKSTLLNAIVGEEVSPVGVTETTAAIMEISHGIKKEGKILKKDGTVDILNIDEIYKKLEQNRSNSDFYEQIEMIKLSYPLKTLQKINIVDTPGMETVTSANQETTKNFIQKADIVLWILSVHHLGQAGINEQIMEVAEHGKPIIMLVNRIDQIEGNIEEIMEYIDDVHGLYINAAFPVSGFKAFEGKRKGNRHLYEESGFPKVMKYLEENIEVSAKEVKDESVAASVQQILHKEVFLIKNILEKMLFAEDSLIKRKGDISYFCKKINAELKRDTDIWLTGEFLQQEEVSIMNEITSNNKAIFSDNVNDIQTMLEEYTSESYLSSHINQFWTKLTDYSEKEKSKALEFIGEKFKQEEEQYKEKYQNQPFFQQNPYFLLSLSNASSDAVEGAKKGAFVGAAYGIAAAAYSAVLGPYAAAITIGTALGSFLPPVLILGAVTGAAFKIVNKEKKTKALLDYSQKQFEDIRNQVSISMQEGVGRLCEANDKYFNEVYQQLNKIILSGITLEEMKQLQSDLKIYINKIEKKIELISVF